MLSPRRRKIQNTSVHKLVIPHAPSFRARVLIAFGTRCVVRTSKITPFHTLRFGQARCRLRPDLDAFYDRGIKVYRFLAEAFFFPE